jgi:hypothetical protein
MSYLTTAPKPDGYGDWGLWVLLGIGGGLRDYARRRRIIANPPKPMARSERAEGSGITKTEKMRTYFEMKRF